MTPAIFSKFLGMFKNKPNGVPGLNGNGDLVGNFVPRTGTLAALQALAGTAGELASATDTPAVVQFTGTAGQGKTFYPTASSLRAAVVPTIPGFIGTNTDVTIGTGKNFADMDAFRTFIEQCVVDESASITLVFDRGVHTGAPPSTGRTWPHIVLCSDQAEFSAPFYGVDISATGAAGAWTLTLTQTGLADALLGVGGATDLNRVVAITTGEFGTNPENAVGIYKGITKVDANTITLTSASGLTAMPVGSTCTLYAPSATLTSIFGGQSSGSYRSVKFGLEGAYEPVALQVTDTNMVDQKIKVVSPGILLSHAKFAPIRCSVDASQIATRDFSPEGGSFPDETAGGMVVFADRFAPIGINAFVQGFFTNQGTAGVTSYSCLKGTLSLNGLVIRNTLADGQLEPTKGGMMAVGSQVTINGTVVTAVNLANYTTLTPGVLSEKGGFIYFG